MSDWTRREILAAFLGLPVTLAGCRSSIAIPEFSGEVVGASDAFGHQLRKLETMRVPEDRWLQSKVVIVGGGVAGLSAGWRLLQGGITDFVILELEAAPGGTSRSGESPIVPHPWGAHYLPAPSRDNKALIALLSEMNVFESVKPDGKVVVAEQYLIRDPEERIFFKGDWYEGLYLHIGESAEDKRQLAAFLKEVQQWVSWRDAKGRRAFTIPSAKCSDDAAVLALDKVTMAAWLDSKGFTSSRLRWLVNYSCKDDYGMTADQTSAWAGLFYFASRIENAGEESRPLIAWPEGNGKIVKHFVSKLVGKIRSGFAVADINPAPSNTDAGKANASLEVMAFDKNGTTIGYKAQHVVFAAPQFLAKYIIRPYRTAPPKHIIDFEYGSWFVANIRMKSRPRSFGFPIAWDNVLYDSPSLGYVVATHQAGMDFGPTVWTYYYPLIGADAKAERQRLLSLDWRSLADIAMVDLRRAHVNLDSHVERIDVMRWGHAMIRPKPGFISGPSRKIARVPFRGIHFANTDLSGIALFEEAFHHGVRAAEEILTARQIKFESIL